MAKKNGKDDPFKNVYESDWMLAEGGDPTVADDYIEAWHTDTFGTRPRSWYESQGLTKPKIDVRGSRGQQAWIKATFGPGGIPTDKGLAATTGLKASGSGDTRKYHCKMPDGIDYMCGPDDPRYTGPEKRKAPGLDSYSYGGYGRPKVDARTAKKQKKFMDSRSTKGVAKFYDSRSARKAGKR